MVTEDTTHGTPIYTTNGRQHTHEPDPNGKIRSILRKDCKELAVENVFCPSGKIVNECKRKHLKLKRTYILKLEQCFFFCFVKAIS